MSKVSKALVSTGSRQTIIQCPSCKTKFAVTAQALSAHDFPRFHCSRCDHLFGMDEQSVIDGFHAQEHQAGERREVVNSKTLTPDAPPPMPAPRPTESESPVFNEPLAWSSSTKDPRSLDIPTEYAPHNPITAPHESAPQDTVLQGAAASETAPQESAAQNFTSGFSVVRPIAEPVVETTIEEKDDFEIPQIAFSFLGGRTKAASTPAAEAAPVPFEPTLQTSGKTPPAESAQRAAAKSILFSAKDLDFDEVPQKSRRRSRRSRSAAAEASAEAALFPGETPRSSNRRTESLPVVTKVSSAWVSFMVILAPLAGFLVLLTATSLYLRSDASAGEHFVELLVPSAAQSAPAGLHVRDARMKTVTLDSGERINIVSGTLVNDTEKRLKDVLIEGLALDSQGKTVSSVRSSASSTLAKTRIKSLTPEMIGNVQSKGSAKRYELRPGDTQEFSLALIGSDLSTARYYSARVYSVKY